MTDLPDVSADMLARAERYARFVVSAERLADAGFVAESELDSRLRGDLVDLAEGNVVIAPRHGRLCYGLVQSVDAKKVTWVYLTPSALDREQQRWGRQERAILDEDYPITMVRHRAAELYGPDSAQLRDQLTDCLEEALRRHIVAKRCTRRRWAAAVPLGERTVIRERVWLCPDHDLAVSPAVV